MIRLDNYTQLYVFSVNIGTRDAIKKKPLDTTYPLRVEAQGEPGRSLSVQCPSAKLLSQWIRWCFSVGYPFNLPKGAISLGLQALDPLGDGSRLSDYDQILAAQRDKYRQEQLNFSDGL